MAYQTLDDLDSVLEALHSLRVSSTKSNNTTADVNKVFKMDSDTNTQIGELIDNISNIEQLEATKNITYNANTLDSPFSHAVSGGLENVNQLQYKEMQINNFNTYMSEADRMITEMDNNENYWQDATVEDIAQLNRFVNDFQSTTTEFKGTDKNRTVAPIGKLTYTSGKSFRNQNQLVNRMQEMKGSVEGAIIALRGDNTIDDMEATLIALGDIEGLKDYSKYTNKSIYDNWMFTKKAINTKKQLIDRYQLHVAKGLLKEMTSSEINAYHNNMLNSIDDQAEEHFYTFRQLVNTAEQGDDYYNQDASDINSNDFQEYLKNEKDEVLNLDPSQFITKKENELTLETNKKNILEKRYYKRTGIDISSEGINTQGLQKKINAKLQGKNLGVTPENPINYSTMTQAPEDGVSSGQATGDGREIYFSESTQTYFTLEAQKEKKEFTVPPKDIKDSLKEGIDNLWLSSGRDIKKKYGSFNKYKAESSKIFDAIIENLKNEKDEYDGIEDKALAESIYTNLILPLTK
jgi:hypothetical protein